MVGCILLDASYKALHKATLSICFWKLEVGHAAIAPFIALAPYKGCLSQMLGKNDKKDMHVPGFISQHSSVFAFGFQSILASTGFSRYVFLSAFKWFKCLN